jgi:phosphomannomutase
MPPVLADAVRRWAADDPDDRDRNELLRLLADGSPAATAELADRFAGRLAFGTAGLRGRMAAGPNRMNRAVVRAASAGVARWLLAHQPDAAERGVVVGCDARHRSAEFAVEAVAVLAGAGLRVHALPHRLPTPVLAFAVRHLDAAAGVMVTASHNPPADNGYKLYLADGAQIVPPVDREVEQAIDSVGPLSAVPLAPPNDPRVAHPGDEVVSAYLAEVTAEWSAPPGGEELTVVYTPLHGVAGRVLLAALDRAGYPPPQVVAEQAEPDPDFPTVAFPNPERPGALDLAMSLGEQVRADVVIANDPDGDRLAVALPDGDGRLHRLPGDRLGVLLGDYVIRRTTAVPQRLVASTIVSSSLLGKLARAEDVRYVETLTGFKWIARAADRFPGSRFVYGYEEALGYLVGDRVRDKDGIGAALAVLALVAEARRAGRSPTSRLDEIESRFGVHATAQVSIPVPDAAARITGLRDRPPTDLADRRIRAVEDLSVGTADLPATDGLVWRLTDGRVVVRPSGTEPLLKAYVELVRPLAGDDLATARTAADRDIDRLAAALRETLQRD